MRDVSISRKLVAVQVFTSSIVLLFCLLAASFVYDGVVEHTVTSALRSSTRITATNCSVALEFNDPEAAREIIMALNLETEIDGVFLVDGSGEEFVRIGNPPPLRTYDLPQGTDTPSEPIIETTSGHVSFTEEVLGRSGKRIGTLIVHADRRQIAEARRISMVIVVSGIVLGALISLGVAVFLQRLISRPILELVGAMQHVTLTGDMRPITHSGGKDEIGSLVAAFNDMIQRIRQRDSELTTERQLLESRVADRTKDLREEIEVRRHTEATNTRLAAAFSQIHDSVVISDSDGIVEFANPALERITGYTQRDVVGKHMRVLIGSHRDESFYVTLWNTLRTDHVWKNKLTNEKVDGTTYTADVTVSEVTDSNGEHINCVLIMRDVTQELQRDLQLRQAQKLEAVGSLAAGIAHEINTPAQFIGDNTRFLKDAFDGLSSIVKQSTESIRKICEGGDSKAELARIEKAADTLDLEFLLEEAPRSIAETLDGVERVTTIVRAMKDFSHPGDEQKQQHDLNKAILSTLTVARNELKYTAEVVTNLDESLPHVPCHLGDINQVILNVCVNAAHAIADALGDGGGKGTITVSTSQDGEFARISISDTGGGIPESIRDRVFEHFFTTKGVGKGTGQGLSIARSVIEEKHGGSLTFETEMGKGTTFHILLPIAPVPDEEPAEACMLAG